MTDEELMIGFEINGERTNNVVESGNFFFETKRRVQILRIFDVANVLIPNVSTRKANKYSKNCKCYAY